MEREILFRGQTRKRGEKIYMDGTPFPGNWVYGGIFAPNDDGDRAIIYDYDECQKYLVYADTDGQFTGLTDKNGTRIFEGDIVTITTHAHGECTGVVAFGKYDRYLPKEHVGFYVEWKDSDCVESLGFYRYIEVIGNIHDNPDLMGSEEE